MPIVRTFKRPADTKIDLVTGRQATYGRRSALTSLLGLSVFAACTPSPPARIASAPPETPAPIPPPLPFDQAVLQAANAVFASTPGPAITPADGRARQLVVIDPLVNGVTGEQSAATEAIGARITELARQKYPQFDIEPFTPRAVSKSPYVLIGTFTPVNAQNQFAGDREAFRFCLVMADLRSGKTVAKSVTFAQLGGVDSTPTAFFRDSPTWTDDAQIKGYINTCQATKVGDPINPVYLDGILAASLVSEAMDAYTAGRYQEAVDLYSNARTTKAGDQLRVFNGLYLANLKLGRQQPAAAAFGDAVDYSLSNKRLGIKFLFSPGTTGFDRNADAAQYAMWLKQIATRTAEKRLCLEVSGHTSKSGSPELNDRISLRRAEYVRDRLAADDPVLTGHLVASGAGFRANLIGTGADNATDALDRRVEFKVVQAC